MAVPAMIPLYLSRILDAPFKGTYYVHGFGSVQGKTNAASAVKPASDLRYFPNAIVSSM
jgi:hypothetical protein